VSCNIDIDLKLNIHDAALIRSYMFQHTKQDSYEFPSARTLIIRKFIQQLDEQIEANLPEDHNHEGL
jgi:hypothetical protein|tara:strand:+ start:153 stop:353 length:201 start_codon:yes stop_codon:yes gene_type:complete